jgi:hypothetical protein
MMFEVCGGSCVAVRWISHTIPTVGNLLGGIFSFLPEPIGVKLLAVKSLRRRHRNEHAQGRAPLRRHGFIKSTPLEGRAAQPPR